MDHEFGSSFLEKGQQGWDWLSLQLDDGTDLMLYQLRRHDGSADPHSSGTIAGPKGSDRGLTSRDFALVPGRRWTSPATNASYPMEWQVTLPGERLELNVRSVLDAQEMSGARSGVSYWEGAVEVEGNRNGKRKKGRGYLEMTGYSGRALGEI